jgi:NAD(P)-dependent dehydrogenase (short-subunit alcohol dehydrogenase family)
MRLEGKKAVVVGAGQTPGATIGNGRATAELFAREGAEVLLVDRDLDAAEETRRAIVAAGGTAITHQADITAERQCEAIVQAAVDAFGRIDILHNNVGIGIHDGSPTRITEEGLDLIVAVNMKGMIWTCKYAFPVMRARESGSVINISSVAAIAAFAGVGYKVTKAAVNAYTQTAALANARYGVRVNCIMPGLMNTPMAIESNLAYGRDLTREDLIARRDAQVPLRHKMGTGWDVAYAALYLASDESSFVTGVCLPVDGGASARVG